MNFARYDRIVEHYPAHWPLLMPGYLPILNAMLDVVLARGAPPGEVLDLGCGPASATIAVAAALGPEPHVTLVDGSAAMLQAAQRFSPVPVRAAICGDYATDEIARWVFGPSRYDLVLASFALHHLGDQHKRLIIEAMAEALRPGGLVLIADEVVSDRPNGWDVVERVRARVIAAHLASGRIDPAFWQLETSLPAELHLPFLPARVDDLTSWMARAGLAVACPLSVFGSALLIGVKA